MFRGGNSKLILSPFEKDLHPFERFYSKRKESAPTGSGFLSFKVDPRGQATG